MAVGPRAPEDGIIDLVFGGHGTDRPADLQLAEARRQIQAIHQHLPGHRREEILHPAHAQGGQHGLLLGPGIGDIASHNAFFLS